MRTTINIDNDLYKAAKSIAAMERKTVGQTISDLIRKALFSREYGEYTDDIPSSRVSENVLPLTSEMVRDAEEDFF